MSVGTRAREAFSLDGQVAAVTGGGQGLGLAAAQLLADAGAAVVLLTRTAAKGEAAAAAIRAAGGRATVHVDDVTRPGAAEALVAAAMQAYGRLDILVNNAAVLLPRYPTTDLPLAEWDRLMDTDVRAVFAMAQAAARQMIAQGGGGRIINLASMVGLTPQPGIVAYSTAKGAVMQLSRALAIDLAPHRITVNAVAPGYVPTQLNETLLSDPDRRHTILAKTPLGRFGQPEEIGAAVLYLASPAAAFITGQCLFVDGGWSVH